MPEIWEKFTKRPNLCYHAVDNKTRLKEWHLWGILTEAKRSPKSIFG
jgi:hypothetical protein